MNYNTSYRQKLGYQNPPKGTELQVKYMEGLKWYLHWNNCTDGEDIVQGWFSTAKKAIKYANENDWKVIV